MSDRDEVISRLIARVERLSAQGAKLEAESHRLRGENRLLREEIERLKRNSSNSSKPPSSDIVKPPKEPKAKSNGQRVWNGLKPRGGGSNATGWFTSTGLSQRTCSRTAS